MKLPSKDWKYSVKQAGFFHFILVGIPSSLILSIKNRGVCVCMSVGVLVYLMFLLNLLTVPYNTAAATVFTSFIIVEFVCSSLITKYIVKKL